MDINSYVNFDTKLLTKFLIAVYRPVEVRTFENYFILPYIPKPRSLIKTAYSINLLEYTLNILKRYIKVIFDS